MAGDNTLINASFKESLSRAGTKVPNLKSLYDANTSVMKTYSGIITGAMNVFKADEEKRRIGKEKQLKVFKNIAMQGEASLAAGETMPQKVLDALDAKVRELQSEFEAVNTYGKGDNVENEKARVRINARLQKVINQAVNARATFTNIGKSINNWNDGEINPDIIAPQMKMMNLKTLDEDNDTTVGFKGDDLTWTTTNYDLNSTENNLYTSFNIQQMADNIGQKNLAADALMVKQFTTERNRGAEHGRDSEMQYSFNDDDSRAEVLSLVKTEEEFKNLARRPLDGLTDRSFRDGLLENIAIDVSILDNMYYDDNNKRVDIGLAFKELNLVQDGVIDSKDLEAGANLSGEELDKFMSNKRMFLDALTDVSNPAFDLEVSRNLFADYYSAMKKQDYDYQFKTARASAPLKAGEAWEGSYKYLPVFSGQRQADYDTGMLMLQSIRDSKKGKDTYFGLFDINYVFDKNSGTWFSEEFKNINDDNTFVKGKGVSTNEVIRMLGLNAPEFQSLRTGLGDVGLNGKNNKGNKTKVPYPKRSITSSNFDSMSDSSDKVLYDLEETYKDYPGFKFENSSSSLLITAPDGTEKYISMDRGGLGDFSGNDESRRAIQKFIEDNYTK